MLEFEFMSYSITEESFISLSSYWKDPNLNLNWASPFVLPVWMEVWWQTFRADAELYLRAVRQDGEIIGIAPLMVKDKTAYIIGSADVCDYLDFIIAPDREKDFFTALLDYLEQKGTNTLNVLSARQDSSVLTELLPVARSRKYSIISDKEDVSLELELPSDWSEYLEALAAKHRHEVERKLRRFSEAGKAAYRSLEDAASVDIFLRLFTESRGDKATFLTAGMESFFRSLADAMAKAGMLRMGILELDNLPAAMVMCFDYNSCVYLYNSGYDPRFRSLSAGLVCKVFCIKDSIERGRKRFDFLKGGEAYKYHLGGREIALYNCVITSGQVRPKRQGDGG